MHERDLFNWKRLVKLWEKHGPPYQIPRRSEYRLDFFKKHGLKFLGGKNVLELGCNAAYFGHHIAPYSRSYIGVEPANLISKKPYKVDYFKQAQITKDYSIGKMELYNQTLKGFCALEKIPSFNALFMSFVLYHLSDKEIDLLKKHILQKCDTVIILTRAQKRPKQHNSYKFWKSKRVVKFLEGQGFNVEVIWEKDKKFSIEIGTRSCEQLPESSSSLSESKPNHQMTESTLPDAPDTPRESTLVSTTESSSQEVKPDSIGNLMIERE